MVSLVTRAPENPMSAPGSASTMSPSDANDARTPPVGRDTLGVRLAVDEPERVGRHHIGVGLAERLRIGQKIDPRERPELEVVAAFLAHAVVALELLVEQHLAAARALRPEMRRELFRLSAERVAEPHARASSSRYQHNPATSGPVCVPLMVPAAAVQYSTQWNRSWTHSPRTWARSGLLVCMEQAWMREPGATRSSMSC